MQFKYELYYGMKFNLKNERKIEENIDLKEKEGKN